MNVLTILKKRICPKCKSIEIIRVPGIIEGAWKCTKCDYVFSEHSNTSEFP